LPEFDISALVVGEAILDVVHNSAGTVEHAGGGPANVAFALARLGVDTVLLTSIGDDDAGRLIARHLQVGGVSLAPESNSSTPTSRAIATIQSDGSAAYDFDVQWSLPATLSLPRAAVIHTGSIAAFLAPGDSAVLELIRQRAAGTVVTFDPNIRPAIIGNLGDAVDRFETLCALANVVKLSDEDAAWLYSGREPGGVASHILDLGASLVVITLGPAGALLMTASASVRVDGRRVIVADTIGAGDTFMASLIDGVLRHRDPAQINAQDLAVLGEHCVTAGAIAVSRAGANPPTRAEIAAFVQA
jgi:fructokinase